MTKMNIERRVALSTKYEFYHLTIDYDSDKQKLKKTLEDIEKAVSHIKELTVTEEDEKPQRVPEISPKKEPTEDTKIADLKAGDKVNMAVRFLKLGEVKAFVRDGKAATYCKCYVEDDSGQIQMTLFDDQIELVKDVKENTWLEIQNGYVKEWKGNLEMSVGKYGTLEVVY